MFTYLLTHLSILLHTNNQKYLYLHLISDITHVSQEFVLCSLRSTGTVFCGISEIFSYHMKIMTALRTCHWMSEIDIILRL